MELEITAHRDMSEVDDATLDSIVDHEREVLGGEDYGEYRFCSNPDCRRMLSLEEVYDTNGKAYRPLTELEDGGSGECECPDCSSPTLHLFDKRVIKPILYADMYRGAYGSVLKDKAGTVKGTCIIQATSLRDCFDNLNYRETLEWEQFRERASEILDMNAEEDSPVINTNRVGINKPYREGGMFLKLGTACGSNMTVAHDELPTFSSVKFGGNVLPLLEGMGHKQIIEDGYDTVVIGMKRFGDLKRAFGLPLQQLSQEFGPQIARSSKAAKEHEAKTRKLKHYRKVPLLDEVQRAIEKLQVKDS